MKIGQLTNHTDGEPTRGVRFHHGRIEVENGSNIRPGWDRMTFRTYASDAAAARAVRRSSYTYEKFSGWQK